jgi:hypothetical protein
VECSGYGYSGGSGGPGLVVPFSYGTDPPITP